MREICSKLTKEAPERRQWCGVIIVNFQQMSIIVLVFPWLTLTLSFWGTVKPIVPKTLNVALSAWGGGGGGLVTSHAYINGQITLFYFFIT